MQIKHKCGKILLTGTTIGEVEGDGVIVRDICFSEEAASRLVSDDMKAAIAEARRFNADAKRREIDELESKLRKLKASL